MNLLLFYSRIELTDFEVGTAVDESGQAATLIYLLVEVEHQFSLGEHTVFEIVGKGYGVEVAGVDAELAEHALSQVVLVVEEHTFLLARFRVFAHFRLDDDGAVGARFLTQSTGCAAVVAVFVAVEDESSAMACGHVQSGIPVFRVLLGHFRSEILLHGDAESRDERFYPFEGLAEI